MYNYDDDFVLQTLKLMKYIVENGHSNFRLGLLKNSRGIREATSMYSLFVTITFDPSFPILI